jgi:dienelactone hydrolase
LVLDTNSASELPPARAAALTAALETLKGENTRSGGPLNGKLATECLVAMGYSMGGGAALMSADGKPAGLKAVISLSPYATSPNTFPNISASTLIMVGADDQTNTPATHGSPFYQSIPGSVAKMYLTLTGGVSDATNSPLGPNGSPRINDRLVARYGLAWLKFNVDGDTRYREFLNRGSTNITAYETTLK